MQSIVTITSCFLSALFLFSVVIPNPEAESSRIAVRTFLLRRTGSDFTSNHLARNQPR